MNDHIDNRLATNHLGKEDKNSTILSGQPLGMLVILASAVDLILVSSLSLVRIQSM